MKVSFEIVPRSAEAFDKQYEYVESLGQRIDMINVPDIQRFKTRSWVTGSKIKRNQHIFIPHFRAVDFSLQSGDIFQVIDDFELDHLLLVSGDPPSGMKKVHNTNVLDLIRSVRARYPDLIIHAGFDPHRNGLQDECDYIKRKVDAGVNGFFSQPFYDIRMVEIYTEQMRGLEVFIGLSPITTQSSKNYWEVKNKVQFSQNFQADYAWNIDFSNQVIALAKEQNFNIYFMPIKIDLDKFFSQLNF